MQYEIETGGRVRHVTVTRTGDRFAVSVDGRLHQVDAARTGAHSVSLIVDAGVASSAQDLPDAGSDKTRPTADETRPTAEKARLGATYDATIAPDADGRLVVLVGAVPVLVRLNGRGSGGRRKSASAAGSGPLRLAAPMPGKVVRILVNVGDAVRTRQPVVVVEAMKMENELRADRDGTVAEIHVREGMLVEPGALLVVIQ